MNTINQATQSALSFISLLPEISPQNKKIAPIALAVFSLIAAIYFAYSRYQPHEKIQIEEKSKLKPVVDLEPVLRSPILEKLGAAKEMDPSSAKTNRMSQRLMDDLDQTKGALAKIQDDFQQLQTLTLDLAKQLDDIK